ncbi:MAG: hypothetical protein J6V42_06275 [Clostridia bacterium]|nr:hypothetical protein [Clostridia bacterium]
MSGIDLRQPNIPSGSDHEMLIAMRSYLYQLREQLQFAFDTLEHTNAPSGTTNTTTIITQGGQGSSSTKPPTEEEAELTFNAIKAFIINSAEIVDSYFQKIDDRILAKGHYVAQTEFEGYQREAEDKYVGRASYDTYVADFETRLETNANNIQLSNHLTETVKADLTKKIDNDVGEVKDELSQNSEVYGYEKEYAMIRKSQGFIKAGFLGENNGKKEYGIEIGLEEKENGRTRQSIGRFSSERVVLYDQNGMPGAELNNNSLLADNVIVDKKQQMGKFIDTVDSRGNIITKWVGERSV